MYAATIEPFSSVYGPINSWRFGRSLSIDPIGAISTCSFDCVYCPLGEIEYKTSERQLFITTEQILEDLSPYAPWDVDAITLSGSGEPTLALNLGDIVKSIRAYTDKPVGVLTNGSLLTKPDVQSELAIADQVTVKIDGVSVDQFRRINRPIPGTAGLKQIWTGLREFRQRYLGYLVLQTMILVPWSDRAQSDYIGFIQQLAPDEIQLNTPTRPRPLNASCHLSTEANFNAAYPLKPVNPQVLQEFSDRIQQAVGIPVRHPSIPWECVR